MKFRRESDEVLYADEAIPRLSETEIEDLKSHAAKQPRRRARICTHPDVEASLHEMFIVHEGGAYIPPHRHLGKSEAMHVIEGTCDVVVFSEQGDVENVVSMGPFGSGECFYHRLDGPRYHTLLVTSDQLVFHEITEGPFRREDTEYAPWAPETDDGEAVQAWMEELRDRVDRYRARTQERG